MDLPGGSTARSTARSTERRDADRAVYDLDYIYSMFDEAPYCHVGFVIDGSPVVLPTVHARVDDTLVFHGSRSNRMFRALVGQEACVTVTLLDGLVLAKSAMLHSMNYRSAVAFGRPRLIDDITGKQDSLEAVVNHVVPGRSAETRPPSPGELALTTVLAMEIDELSAKVRTGPPVEDEEDLSLPWWPGVVPARSSWGEPVVARDGPDLFPASLVGLLARRAEPAGEAIGVHPATDIAI